MKPLFTIKRKGTRVIQEFTKINGFAGLLCEFIGDFSHSTEVHILSCLKYNKQGKMQNRGSVLSSRKSDGQKATRKGREYFSSLPIPSA